MPPASRVRIFLSYAHADDSLRQRLRAHLSALEREGLVQAWDDRQILGGDEWADDIDERLNGADVILVLVSADFIQSEYCYGKELRRALERHADENDRAIVIPVILRACDWRNTPLGTLQALPHDARPLSEWKSEDDYFADVAIGLRRRIRRLVEPDRGWVGSAGQRLRDPALWRRPSVWAGIGGVVLLAASATTWWTRAVSAAERDVSTALQALRTGRYDDAVQALEPACRRWPGRRGACFALDKARLAALLARPEPAPADPPGARVDALKSAHLDDPDLLLLSAQLALREDRPERHLQALADISRAIALTNGDFPEAYFYLAHLHLQAGHPAKALPLLDKALRSMTVAPEHYLNMRAYARAHTGDLAGARLDYEQSAERGSILSRIELAELLWRTNEFDRARDQLAAAERSLHTDGAALSGRNAFPWAFELAPGKTVILRQGFEKHCHARWMLRAARALAGEPASDAGADWAGCGPESTRIAAAVVASLQRASRSGMNEAGQARALAFARRNDLPLRSPGSPMQ